MDVQVSRLLLLNSVLDPFVYVLTRRQYRRMVWAFVRCRAMQRIYGQVGITTAHVHVS